MSTAMMRPGRQQPVTPLGALLRGLLAGSGYHLLYGVGGAGAYERLVRLAP